MRIVERVRVEAPRAQVWELVSDPRRWPEFMDGLVVSEVLSEQVTGCGARWAIRFQVGAAALGGTVEVVEFHEPADLAWNGVTGISMRGRWRLREHDLPRGELSMRRSGDRRPARLAKLQLLRRLAEGRVVAVVVDDDEQVCDAYEAAGFRVLRARWQEGSPVLEQAQEAEGRT